MSENHKMFVVTSSLRNNTVHTLTIHVGVDVDVGVDVGVGVALKI